MLPGFRRSSSLLAALVLLVGTTARAAPPELGGALPGPLPLFPPTNWWNQDISLAPVDSSSAAFISFIGPGRGLHPDLGGEQCPGCVGIYGMPYIVVDSAQPKRTVTFHYDDESDHVGYPIPDEAITQAHWIEGGEPGDQDPGGDRHMLIVDRDNKYLYELFSLHYDGSKWTAGSGAFFDMKTNNRRPEGWTSADAAGLAILPGLLRYDEVYGPDEIRHALRVTVRATNGHVWPASHSAGSTAGALPMGARLRLKASKNISGFPADVQKIFRAMKSHGLIVADNGADMFVGGTFDTRWNNDVLNPAFAALTASDFEVVQLGWVGTPALTLTSPNGGQSWPVGSLQVISWAAANLNPNATIKLSYTNGTTTNAIASGLPPTSGSYDWTVPNDQASNWKVNVCSDVGGSCEVQDSSDASFSITATASPPASRDFNGDGHADILWHNQVTGGLYAWFLGGTKGVVTQGGSHLTPPSFSDTRWQIRGIADFNHDGRNDILWHNQTTGDLYVWLLGGTNGVVAASGSYLNPKSFSDTRWQIRGIADFDGDGNMDILWHHQTTGDLYVWFLNGLTVTRGSYLTPKSFTDTQWQIRGIADFNHDGKADILWHHQANGSLYVWFLGGTGGVVTQGGSYLTPRSFSDTLWKIVELADFDGDGDVDLLWHHQGNGSLYVWFLGGTNGVVTQGGSYLTPSAFSDTSWKVAPR
jgi:hypothetical protein